MGVITGVSRLPYAVSGACMAGCLMLAGCSPYRLAGEATALDGDTIVVGTAHVRLLRIDAPELPGHPCPVGRRPSCNDRDPDYAYESQRALQRLLDTGDVYCVSDNPPWPIRKDAYGRYLAECYTDHGTNIGDAMLASAMAVPYRR